MRVESNLKTLTDDERLRRLSDLLRDSRRVEADLIAHIAEVDARRLYAREAAPSMFAYCTERLHLSERGTTLRIRVARTARQQGIDREARPCATRRAVTRHGQRAPGPPTRGGSHEWR